MCAAPENPAPAPYRVVLDDPSGDERGPGHYVPPSDNVYTRGVFDLRRLEIRVDGAYVVFEVTFGAVIREPHQVRRSNAQRIPLDNGIYLKNVDIYVDTDGSPLTGTTEVVPGRNVKLDGASPWDKAVLITPQPALARSVMDGWRHAPHVLTPVGVQNVGPTVIARVPVAELGVPARHWGYAVMISGALWEESFDAVGRLLGDYEKNVLTLPVLTVAENQIFGGGEMHGLHPWVVDVLVPEGKTQKEVLSSFDVARKQLATVPMVYPFPEAHAAKAAALPALPMVRTPTTPAAPAGTVLLTVKDVKDDMVVLSKSDGEVKQFTLGTVLDSEGQAVAQVVVTAVYPKFVLATAVEGADAIVVGAAVRFNPSKEPKEVRK